MAQGVVQRLVQRPVQQLGTQPVTMVIYAIDGIRGEVSHERRAMKNP